MRDYNKSERESYKTIKLKRSPPPLNLELKLGSTHICQGGEGSRQHGIFPGSQGARLQQNLQTHTKFCQHFMLFWHKFDFKVCIFCKTKKFFLSHTTCRKYFLDTGRHFLALQVINCHRSKFIGIERNLLSRAEIS